MPNFAIHMFAALVCVHFFTETFSSGTRSIVQNKAIVRKMAMPREMFPVAVGDRLGGQLVPAAADPVRRRASRWAGTPTRGRSRAALLGLAIITVFGTALALLFAGMNVFFRDFQNIVATFSMFTTGSCR